VTLRFPALGTPLLPEPEVDQADPYLLRVPDPAAAGYPYYLYVTSPGFPVYGSEDLVGWRSLGPSMQPASPAWHWAPCVRYVDGLERPWVMLYSRGKGAGEVLGHQEHRIRRADSLRPEGPFVDSGEVVTEGLDFAIDPDVYAKPDGSLWLAYATDYVEDEPYGTGIAEAPVTPDLRALAGPPRTIARASSTWQVYDPARVMPWKRIPGVDWSRGDTVRWHCLEGPVGLTSPRGEQVMLYSGGNFTGSYGIGVARESPGGRWQDLSTEPATRILQTAPELGVYGPGHCSALVQPDGGAYVCFHFRTAPEALRQFAILALRWDDQGLPTLLGGD